MAQQNSATATSETGFTVFTVNIVLTKLVKGKWVIKDANCEFQVQWNSIKNMGTATLLTINGDKIGILLHPTGIEGQTDFMSDIKPTEYVVNGERVFINRVILDYNGVLQSTPTEQSRWSAAIMFNKDGSTLETSDNWRDQ